MSTIEEAREQAREALELIHTWAQREQAWDTPRALDFARIGASIRALLDATEPPSEDMGPAASCHLCVGAGGYEDYDGEWVGCSCQRTHEPMRDADGDMISSGEHRKISMSGDSFFVCDTCTNVLGLNVRWDHASKREDHQAAVESLPVKPAEDESEALVEVIDILESADTSILREVLAKAWDEGMAYGVNYDAGDYEVAPEPIENPYRTEQS